MNKCKPVFIIKAMMLALLVLWFGLNVEAEAQQLVGPLYGCPSAVPPQPFPFWIFSQNYGSVQVRVSTYHVDAINFGPTAGYKTACSSPHFNIHVIFDSLNTAGRSIVFNYHLGVYSRIKESCNPPSVCVNRSFKPNPNGTCAYVYLSRKTIDNISTVNETSDSTSVGFLDIAGIPGEICRRDLTTRSPKTIEVLSAALGLILDDAVARARDVEIPNGNVDPGVVPDLEGSGEAVKAGIRGGIDQGLEDPVTGRKRTLPYPWDGEVKVFTIGDTVLEVYEAGVVDDFVLAGSLSGLSEDSDASWIPIYLMNADGSVLSAHGLGTFERLVQASPLPGDFSIQYCPYVVDFSTTGGSPSYFNAFDIDDRRTEQWPLSWACASSAVLVQAALQNLTQYFYHDVIGLSDASSYSEEFSQVVGGFMCDTVLVFGCEISVDTEPAVVQSIEEVRFDLFESLANIITEVLGPSLIKSVYGNRQNDTPQIVFETAIDGVSEDEIVFLNEIKIVREIEGSLELVEISLFSKFQYESLFAGGPLIENETYNNTWHGLNVSPDGVDLVFTDHAMGEMPDNDVTYYITVLYVDQSQSRRVINIPASTPPLSVLLSSPSANGGMTYIFFMVGFILIAICTFAYKRRI